MKQLIAEQIKLVLENEDGFNFLKKSKTQSSSSDEDAENKKIVALD